MPVSYAVKVCDTNSLNSITKNILIIYNHITITITRLIIKL